MPRTLRLLVVLALSLPLSAFGTAAQAAARSAPGTAEGAAEAFYARYVRLKPTGIPTAAQRRQLEELVSPGLAAALRDAAAAESRHRKATRNREPPLMEGDLFSSLFEGPTAAKVGTCRTEGERAVCEVALRHVAKGSPPVEWTDRATLVRQHGRWSIDDIAYGARWDFGNRGSVRATLKDIASWRP